MSPILNEDNVAGTPSIKSATPLHIQDDFAFLLAVSKPLFKLLNYKPYFYTYIIPYFCIALSFTKWYNSYVTQTFFEWDEEKNEENQKKHGVSFTLAQHAFLDPHRVIAEDATHGREEERFHCIGHVGDGVMTGRFPYRGNIIRIYGAGYWRKGRKIYEEENKIYR